MRIYSTNHDFSLLSDSSGKLHLTGVTYVIVVFIPGEKSHFLCKKNTFKILWHVHLIEFMGHGSCQNKRIQRPISWWVRIEIYNKECKAWKTIRKHMYHNNQIKWDGSLLVWHSLAYKFSSINVTQVCIL